MTFDAREATRAAEAAYPPFHFVGMDGADYYIPNPMMVDPGLAKRVQAGEITGAQLLEELAPEAATAIDLMVPGVQRALIAAWREAASEELDALGKEPAPPSPTPPSAARSSQSSRSGAKTSGRSRSGG